jgi:hypothetical protein
MDLRAETELQVQLGSRPGETQSGLLVLVAQQAERFQFFETLTEGLRVPMKVYVYTARHKVETLVASLLVGCRHVAEVQTKLVPDPVAAGLFGLARFPDQSQLNEFLRALGPDQVQHLGAAHQQLLEQHSRAGDRTAWTMLPHGHRVLTVDLDQTYLATRSTQAEQAARGYFGRKRTAFGYHKSVAYLGGEVKELLYTALEPGNTHAQEAVAPTLTRLAALAQARGFALSEVLVRGDSQYGSVGVLRQLQAAGVHYLVKGYATHTARQLVDAVPPTAVWQARGTDSYGSQLWVVDAGEQALHAHDDRAATPALRTRVVLLARVQWRTRRKRGHGAPAQVRDKVVTFEHYLTDRSAADLTAGEVLDVYNARETEESFFRAEQDSFGAHYLRTRHFHGQAAFLWLLASTVNLLRWTQHTQFAGTPLAEVGVTKLVTQALRLPATVQQLTDRLWTITFPETAGLIRQLLAAWAQHQWQLPLPFQELSP